MTGKYGLVITNVIRTLGSATVLGLGALLFILIRRDRHRTLPRAGGLPKHMQIPLFPEAASAIADERRLSLLLSVRW